ncbi:hypothetical protein BLOT_001905 [Blomia tropicalis]|nr:hypothetical protein BLOT_001905 [Blomia tropicalis]
MEKLPDIKTKGRTLLESKHIPKSHFGDCPNKQQLGKKNVKPNLTTPTDAKEDFLLKKENKQAITKTNELNKVAVNYNKFETISLISTGSMDSFGQAFYSRNDEYRPIKTMDQKIETTSQQKLQFIQLSPNRINLDQVRLHQHHNIIGSLVFMIPLIGIKIIPVFFNSDGYLGIQSNDQEMLELTKSIQSMAHLVLYNERLMAQVQSLRLPFTIRSSKESIKMDLFNQNENQPKSTFINQTSKNVGHLDTFSYEDTIEVFGVLH